VQYKYVFMNAYDMHTMISLNTYKMQHYAK